MMILFLCVYQTYRADSFFEYTHILYALCNMIYTRNISSLLFSNVKFVLMFILFFLRYRYNIVILFVLSISVRFKINIGIHFPNYNNYILPL